MAFEREQSAGERMTRCANAIADLPDQSSVRSSRPPTEGFIAMHSVAQYRQL
jgi:hypothetical protein